MLRGQIEKHLLLLSLSLALGAALNSGSVCSAAQPAASEPSDKDIVLLENRYFAHAYSHDPVEKRLERLECLIFGSTRSGSIGDRFAKLNKAVATRSQTPLPVEKAAVAPGVTMGVPSGTTQATPGKTVAPPTSSSQYPILNTLEWRALKKTFPSESLDQRLDRLESKMFGQPAQTMAYIDRVDRLKKTLGFGIGNTTGGDTPLARGPMPKARGRDEMDMGGAGIGNLYGMGNGLGNGTGGIQIEGMMPPVFNPFSSGSQLDTIFGATFDKMFTDMNRQMSEAQRLGPGNWVLDPKTNSWMEMGSGKRVPSSGGAFNNGINITPNSQGQHAMPYARPNMVPNAMPKRQNFPIFPGAQMQPNTGDTIQELPPYADPNSI